MLNKTSLIRLMMGFVLVVVLTGCGAPATPKLEADPNEVATFLAPTIQAQTPITTDAPQPPVPSIAPSHTPSPTLTEAPLVYTSDGSQCKRNGFVIIGGGGEGQAKFPPIDLGEAVTLELRFEGEQVSKALFSPDGGKLLALGWQRARLWDTVTGAQHAEIELKEDDGSISDAAFSPDGRLVYIGNWRGDVQVWEPGSNTMIPLTDMNGEFAKLDADPDGNWIAASYHPPGNLENPWDYPSQIVLLDAASGETVRRFEGEVLEKREEGDSGYFHATFTKGHFYPIHSVQFSPNGQAILTAGYDAAIRLWDAATGEHLRCFELPWDDSDEMMVNNFDSYTWAEFSPDGRKVLGLFIDSGTHTASVLVWDALSGQLLLKIPYLDDIVKAEFRKFNSAAFSPDGGSILTAGGDNQVRVWDARSGELVMALWHPAETIWAGFHPSGEIIATAFHESGDPPNTHLWFWDTSHPDLEKALETSRRLSEAYRAFLEGRGEEALTLINEIAGKESSVIAGALYTQACRYAALWDWSSQALPTCQKAVNLADSLGNDEMRLAAHESYAIALVHTGDLSHAASEFEICVSISPSLGEDLLDYDREYWISTRENWVALLQAGVYPFSVEDITGFQWEFLPPTNR